MSDDKSLDVSGFGKMAKAIPAKAWNRLTETACNTVEQVLAPITATTSGVGRLIAAKFDRLVDAEKILVAEVLKKTQEKVAIAQRPFATSAKPSIIIPVIEHSAIETDEELRELW